MEKNKLLMQTPNLADRNYALLAGLFPNSITETTDENGAVVRAIDADVLAQEINTCVVSGKEERYQFTWPDKKKSIFLANAPSAAALRPCREESEDFNNTENLYIEGDNLDVLKLLRETYLNRVKMIYIDPPYNTGKDFVYEDDFSESADSFLSRDGQYDKQGNRLTPNLDNNGRFHTDWLNMIYPRLRLARDLLSDYGAIFISIDDNEVENLKKICNEVFGNDNLIGTIANVNNPKGRSDDKYIATSHEYILVYAKHKEQVEWFGFAPTEEITRRYNKVDNNGKKYREIDLRKTGENDLREDRPNLFYYFYYNESTGDFYPSREDKCIDGYLQIKPLREDGREGNWRWGLDNATQNISELMPKFMPTRKIWGVMQKDPLEGRDLVKPIGSWTFKDVNSERGSEEFIKLGFDKRIFPKPKPLGTITRCLQLTTSKEDIILDFFSGSATTAHAVMQLNVEDGGKRKFVMVQLPEPCDEKSEAYKAGYKNICEIGKERIRRAGQKIKEENKDKPDIEKLDTGFRVLKLDSSNMKDVYYTPEEYAQMNFALDGFMDNIKEDRTDEDLLFQMMLDLGIPLSAKIEQHNGAFYVNDNYLIAFFDKVDTDIITDIAKKRPYYAVFRDSSFLSDSALVNFEQVFSTYSPKTIRKVL